VGKVARDFLFKPDYGMVFTSRR
jgi:putative transposase